MKKIALIGVLLLIGFTLMAAELTSDAKIVKEHLPVSYESIKDMAEEEWGTDYPMILYVINQQCEALLDSMELVADNYDEFLYALIEWTEGGIDVLIASQESGGTIYDCRTDWTMVVYVANQQIDAKGKY